MIQKATDHFLTGSPPLTGIHVCYCRTGQKPTACEVLDPRGKAIAAALPNGHTVPVRFLLNVCVCTYTGVMLSALVREALLHSGRWWLLRLTPGENAENKWVLGAHLETRRLLMPFRRSRKTAEEEAEWNIRARRRGEVQAESRLPDTASVVTHARPVQYCTWMREAIVRLHATPTYL